MFPGAISLTHPVDVAVSPNGASVYSANEGGTLAHLFANPSQGQLTWDGCVSNDGSGGNCLDVPGSGLPLEEPFGVAVSPNGASVYAANAGGLNAPPRAPRSTTRSPTRATDSCPGTGASATMGLEAPAPTFRGAGLRYRTHWMLR